MRQYASSKQCGLYQLLPMLALLAAAPAQASYVLSCELQGKLVSEPEFLRAYVDRGKGEIEETDVRFRFEIRSIKTLPGSHGLCSGKFRSGDVVSISASATCHLDSIRLILARPELRLEYHCMDNKGGLRADRFSLKHPVC